MAEMHAPLVKVAGLSRYFDVSAPWLNRVLDGQPRLILKAVDGLDFEINRGETLALVGESGCGKSTVARLVVGLYRPSAGSIVFDGVDMAGLGGRAEMAPIRRRLQMIFQDPFASLNPRWRVSAIVSEPIRAFRLLDDERLIVERVGQLLRQVGLSPVDGEKYPHEFSGGQRQRIAIARALAARPALVVCDEPTSALDVSVQSQILNMMRDLQDEFGLSYIFISHDLAVVKFISDEVLVMQNGDVVEQNNTQELLARPQQDYTRRLLGAIPRGYQARPAAV